MDLELSERTSIECIQQAVQMSTQFVIELGNELRDLLLDDRGGQVNIPSRQAGKCF